MYFQAVNGTMQINVERMQSTLWLSEKQVAMSESIKTATDTMANNASMPYEYQHIRCSIRNVRTGYAK